MSNENDVPLGEGSRRYYDRLFGDRIRQVNKGGAPRRDSSGPTGSGRAGCGVLIAVFVLIRILSLVFRTHPSTLPTLPHFEVGMPQQPRDWGVPHARDNDDEAKVLLAKEDVPLLGGLCYRIAKESRQLESTPGKRICELLPPDANALLRRAANGELLRDDEQEVLLEALDELLHDATFYDGRSFRHVPGVARLRPRIDNGPAAAPGTPRFNRLVLEKCYPEQIVPFNERRHLDPQERERWRLRAQRDLNQARQEHD
jgi:hypothetical protein